MLSKNSLRNVILILINFTGLMNENTGSYSYGFIFTGFILLLSGLMLFVVPSLQNKKLKNQEKSRTMDQSI